jgi:hypothetical protein
MVSASRIAPPSRSNSPPVRKRSRRLSLNLSMPRAGLVPSGTMPARPAKAYILPTTASTRLAWKGVSDSEECSLPIWSRVSLSALVVPKESRSGVCN